VDETLQRWIKSRRGGGNPNIYLFLYCGKNLRKKKGIPY
jgi:hypothetical protein